MNDGSASMTDQEKRQQRIEIELELEDAQKELASLRVKALRMAENIDHVAAKIRANANLTPSRDDFNSESDLANRLEPTHQLAMSFENAAKLIDELKTARQKVFRSKELKASLTNGGDSFTATI
jgi:hypothetical protein